MKLKRMSTPAPEFPSRKLQPRGKSFWKICGALKIYSQHHGGKYKHIVTVEEPAENLDLYIELLIDTCLTSNTSANLVNGFRGPYIDR